MITPDSFVETKYYIKFSNIEDYTDVSGTVEEFAVVKPGKIPMTKRNKDFTLQIMTFSFDLYSIREVLRGQKFKATRTESGVETEIFHGFVDTVDYDEDKNEYNIRIAHEFKYLQRYNVRKTELESVLTSAGCTAVLKQLVELVIDREIDFSAAELYEPEPGIVLASAIFYLKMFWCVGIDNAISNPNEDATASYWDVLSQTIGMLGCVVFYDGTKYIVKHLTQVNNYDIDTVGFLDKRKNKYIPANEMYYSCGFVANYNADLTTYDTVTLDDLSEYRDYFAVIRNRDAVVGVANLKPFLTIGVTSRLDLLNIGRNDSTLNNQKLYIDDYYNQSITIDYNTDSKLPLSIEYDPIQDNMGVVQHEPYDFQLLEYYYYNPAKAPIDGTETLKHSDSIYIEFNKDIDENSLSFIEIRQNGVEVTNVDKYFMKSSSASDSKVIRLKFYSLVDGTYQIYISKEFKSITQRKIPLDYLVTQKNFIVYQEGP